MFVEVNGRILDTAVLEEEIMALRSELSFQLGDLLSRYGFERQGNFLFVRRDLGLSISVLVQRFA